MAFGQRTRSLAEIRQMTDLEHRIIRYAKLLEYVLKRISPKDDIERDLNDLITFHRDRFTTSGSGRVHFARRVRNSLVHDGDEERQETFSDPQLAEASRIFDQAILDVCQRLSNDMRREFLGESFAAPSEPMRESEDAKTHGLQPREPLTSPPPTPPSYLRPSPPPPQRGAEGWIVLGGVLAMILVFVFSLPRHNNSQRSAASVVPAQEVLRSKPPVIQPAASLYIFIGRCHACAWSDWQTDTLGTLLNAGFHAVTGQLKRDGTIVLEEPTDWLTGIIVGPFANAALAQEAFGQLIEILRPLPGKFDSPDHAKFSYEVADDIETNRATVSLYNIVISIPQNTGLALDSVTEMSVRTGQYELTLLGCKYVKVDDLLTLTDIWVVECEYNITPLERDADFHGIYDQAWYQAGDHEESVTSDGISLQDGNAWARFFHVSKGVPIRAASNFRIPLGVSSLSKLRLGLTEESLSLTEGPQGYLYNVPISP